MPTYTKCPNCNIKVAPEDTDDPIMPIQGGVLTCANCGGLFVFEGLSWREPTPEERKHLLETDEVIGALAFAQELGMWRDRDLADIAACSMPILLALASSATTVDVAARDLAVALTDAGFHTHPQQHADYEEPTDE